MKLLKPLEKDEEYEVRKAVAGIKANIKKASDRQIVYKKSAPFANKGRVRNSPFEKTIRE